jgi:hypothetical protein
LAKQTIDNELHLLKTSRYDEESEISKLFALFRSLLQLDGSWADQ